MTADVPFAELDPEDEFGAREEGGGAVISRETHGFGSSDEEEAVRGKRRLGGGRGVVANPYGGVRSSRRELDESESESEEEEEESGDESASYDDDDEEVEGAEEDDESHDSRVSSASEAGSDDDDDDDDSSSSSATMGAAGGELDAEMTKLAEEMRAIEAEDEEASEDGDAGVFGRAGGNRLSAEREKAMHVRHQKQLYASLLQQRIFLQKALPLANGLPPSGAWPKSKPVQEAAARACNEVALLLNDLCELRATTGKAGGVCLPPKDLGELPTPPPVDDASGDDDEEAERKASFEPLFLDRKRKRGDDVIQGYWDVVDKYNRSNAAVAAVSVDRWWRKAGGGAAAGGKSFKAFDQSITKQVQTILQDRSRLLQRTQLVRGNYKRLAREPKRADGDDEVQKDASGREYDEEVFDDTDFYQQLLREFIEGGGEAGDGGANGEDADPFSASRRALATRKLMKKQHRVVDRKATKGRRIKYDVQPKLVNFVPPRADLDDPDREAMADALFPRLFASAV